MPLFKIYGADEFDNWYQDFEKKANVKLTESNLNLLKNWSVSLLDFQNYLTFLGKGGFAKAFLLNNDVVVKVDSIHRQRVLGEKLKNFPILNDYVVPTYILMNKFDNPIKIKNPDCLILQPYCQRLTPEEYARYKNSKKLDNLMQYCPEIDTGSQRNYGFLNGELKLFDW